MILVPTLLALVLTQAPTPATPPVIEPAAALKLDGIPPIPKAFAAGVRRYTESRSARFQDWHPTKRELVISTRFGESQQLHRLRTPGGAREQLTYLAGPVGNRDDDAASYTADGAALVVYADNDGDENYQLHRLDLKSGGLALLTDGASRNGTPVWTEPRDRFVYTSTRRNKKDFDLYLGTPGSAETKRLLEVQGQWYPVEFSRDGKTLAVVNYLSANESHLYLVDVASGTKRHLTEGLKVRVDGVEFSEDGKSLFVLTDRGSEFLQLQKLELASMQWRSLTPGLKWDVEELAMSPDARTLAYGVNEDGFSRLYLMDARSGRTRRIDGLPDGIVFGLSWHRNGRDLGFTVSAHDLPGDVFSVDARSGKLTQWTFSEVGPVDRSELAPPEAITWKGHDGLTLHGVMYRPPASKFQGPRPVLLAHRGGPESQSRPGFIGTTNYYLNELGMAVIYLNLRGQPGYGKTYLAADDGLKREDAYKDIGSLLDWVAQRPELDRTRVVFSGGSYGGHLALMSAYLYADRLIGIIDNVGISSFLTFLTNTAEYRRDLRRVEYGDERVPELRAWMEKTAPLNNTSRMKDPMLVIQGRNDPRVPISEADQIVKQVRQNGVPVWYLVADDEGHGFFKKSNVEVQLYVTAAFLQKLLQEGPDALRAPPAR